MTELEKTELSQMTELEKAELIRDQHTAGIEHGIAIAAIILEKFPSRSTRYVRRKLKKIASISNVLNTLIANGVEAQFRQSFEDGYAIGLSNALDHKVTKIG